MVLGHAATRRQQLRQDMTGAILNAARAVMRQDGVAALNLHEVARRVGVRAPSLYEYFDGKDALYDALFRQGVDLWAERVEALRSTEFETPWDFLRAVFEAYLDFADDHPEMYQLVHERHVPGFVPSPESLEESVRLTQAGAETLAAWMDRGALAPGMEAGQAFDLVIAVMHGLTGGHVANEPGNRDPESRFRRLVPAAIRLFQAAWSPADMAPPPQGAQPN